MYWEKLVPNLVLQNKQSNLRIDLYKDGLCLCAVCVGYIVIYGSDVTSF